MLVTVNNLKQIACHWSHASQIVALKALVTQPTLVRAMILDGCWSLASRVTIYKSLQKIFGSPSKNTDTKKKENKKSVRTQALRAESPPQSQHPTRYSIHNSSESEDISFSNYYVTSRWSRDHKVLRL